MAKVTTPVPGFTGRVAGVDFKDGSGETDDDNALAYFERQGYGIDGSEPEIDESQLEEIAVPVVGVPIPEIDDGGQRDAADPRNELIPVGGVKSDGTVVAGPGKGKRIAAAPPASPSEPVQETGDPGTQSSSPSATNPTDATATQPATGKAATKSPDPAATPDTGSTSSDTKGA